MINRVILIGNLVKDPILNTTETNKRVCTFNIAIQKGKGKYKKVSYIPITTWETQAVNCEKYLKKGSKVAIEGELSTDSYKKDGELKVKMHVTANLVEFINSPKNQDNSSVNDFNNCPF